MKLGILNEDLGIATVDSLDDIGNIHIDIIKKQLPEGARLDDFVFFYMTDRDWIVMNKNHKLYQYYLDIITGYLELSEESRKKCVELVHTEMFKNAFAILDSVIIRRTLIYGMV